MQSALKNLVELSRFAAEHPRLVQGGGGNCSVKSGNKMWIKASGYFMEDLSETRGFAVVDSVSGKSLETSGAKPSMETPLHTLLGNFVIHTHPVAVTALVSSLEGADFFRKLFPQTDHVWVDFAPPGEKLYLKVKRSLLFGETQKKLALFLQNHGLFVSSSSKSEAMKLHETIVARMEDFFKINDALPEIPAGFYLTPDHAVYSGLSGPAASDRQRISYEETLLLVRQVLGMLRAKGWTPRCLPPAAAAEILGMDEEKFRQHLWSQS